MSQVNALSSINNTVRSGGGGMSELSTDDFMNIVLTELTKQDPLSPNDTNQLLQQMATIRGIQSDMDLGRNLQTMTEQNSFAAASQMIGKVIQGMNTDLERTESRVVSVLRTQGGIVLDCENGDRVPLDWVDGVQDKEAQP
jgi:flagellar basal-body rod modification protein FlgD